MLMSNERENMPRIEKEIIIQNKNGLHVRVASELVRVASQFASDVTILKDGREINAKSIMSVLTLEASFESALTLIVDGPDADSAAPELEQLLLSEEHHE